jgi:hypothetical protein
MKKYLFSSRKRLEPCEVNVGQTQPLMQENPLFLARIKAYLGFFTISSNFVDHEDGFNPPRINNGSWE